MWGSCQGRSLKKCLPRPEWELTSQGPERSEHEKQEGAGGEPGVEEAAGGPAPLTAQAQSKPHH